MKMFEFLRRHTRSDDDKRLELINAYLDGALSEKERSNFEQRLSTDQQLRGELAQFRWLRESINQLPKNTAPRNFTLDPALFGAVEPSSSIGLYPVLRTATIFVGIIFIFMIGIDLSSSSSGSSVLDQPSSVESDLAANVVEFDAEDNAKTLVEPAEAPAEEALPALSAPQMENLELEREKDERSEETVNQESLPLVASEEMEQEESYPSPTQIPTDSQPSSDAPESLPAEEIESAENIGDGASESESDSALPSSSGLLTDLAAGTPPPQELPLSTTIFSEPEDIEAEAYPADGVDEVGVLEEAAPTEPEFGEGAVQELGATIDLPSETDVGDDTFVPTSQAETILKIDSTREDERERTFLILEIFLGVSIIILVVFTLIARDRSRKNI